MDVCYNTTGSLRAINDIMNANGFDTYTPQLEAGRIIEVPDVVYNSEAVSVADARPFNSASLPFDNLSMQMEQLEFMLGDVGSIIYTFDGSKIAGKYLSLNAYNNNEGYVNWGDGTPVEYIKNNVPFGHNYAAGTTGEIVVTFLGRTGAFFLGTQSFDQEAFKQSLIKVDITNADAACHPACGEMPFGAVIIWWKLWVLLLVSRTLKLPTPCLLIHGGLILYLPKCSVGALIWKM